MKAQLRATVGSFLKTTLGHCHCHCQCLVYPDCCSAAQCFGIKDVFVWTVLVGAAAAGGAGGGGGSAGSAGSAAGSGDGVVVVAATQYESDQPGNQ